MGRDDELDRALAAIEAGAAARDLETGTLEFKEQVKSHDKTIGDIVDAVLCLVNGSGGVVAVGVSNSLSGPQAFKGTDLDAGIVRRRVYELSRPPLTVDSEIVTRGGQRLLVIYVPLSPEIHADTQGRAIRRVGKDCIPMAPNEVARLREERQGVDPSAQPSDRTLSDVRPAALAAARNRLATFTDERRRLARLGDEDLLRALGVLDRKKQLLKAGEILFCGPRGRGQPAILYQYRQTQGGEPRTIERLDPPLLLAFDKVMSFVQARQNMTPLNLPSGQQINIEDFPELAVREALANAVIHRDYHVNASVTVEHSPQVFVVTSPGPLVSGVTTENILTHPSKPRNPALASAIRQFGLAEEVGRGVDRMYREMIRSGREAPKIEDLVDHVRVTLVGGAPNTQIARFVAQLPEDERDDTDTMLVLHRLCRVKLVSAIDMAATLQKPVDEAEAALRRLAADEVGILEPTRQTARNAHPSYRLRGEVLKSLGSAVPYQRRTMDETDRKIIAHVREYRTITNRTVQNLFDVGIQRASNILADLVQRKILAKKSTHERGPGVQYGPGAKFPPKARRAG